ncbi:MAG: hypothetical protein QXW47_11070 [Candidatus Jordarchaeales archaeon]
MKGDRKAVFSPLGYSSFLQVLEVTLRPDDFIITRSGSPVSHVLVGMLLIQNFWKTFSHMDFSMPESLKNK